MTTISIDVPDPRTPLAAAALRLLSLLAQHPDLPAPVRWTVAEHSLVGWFATGTVAEANAAMVPWALVAGVDKVRVGAADGGRTLWSLRWVRGTGWVEMAMYCADTAAWRRVHPERYEREIDGVAWALEDCAEDEIGPEDPGPGWYLYGPGEYAEGRFVAADSDTVPIATADASITAARLRAHCTAEYGGPGYTTCTLAVGHDGHHTGPLGTMRTARWATNLNDTEAPA